MVQKRKKKLPLCPPCFESDMANERCPASKHEKGIFYTEEKSESFHLCHTVITESAAAEKVGRPIGNYETLSFASPTLLTARDKGVIEKKLTALLLSSLPKAATRILVVGLGNKELTVDSIGPLAAEGVTATAALETAMPSLFENGQKRISVFCPGVFGETGIESTALIRSAVSLTGAEAVLAIDAMATAVPSHLLRAVEITDTGTVPGAGVGNRRTAVDVKTVGVPVTAIGIPTMMRARPYLRRALTDFGVEKSKAETYAEKSTDLLLIPHGLDEGTRLLSHLLSRAIDRAFGFAEE